MDVDWSITHGKRSLLTAVWLSLQETIFIKNRKETALEYCHDNCYRFSSHFMVLTASHDGEARLWWVASGEYVRTLQGHSGAVLSAVFSPQGAVGQHGRESLLAPSCFAAAYQA